MVVGQNIVSVVCNGVAAHYRMVGETDINALERLVQKRAVFHQNAVVEGVYVLTLVIQANVTVFEMTAHELVVMANPLATVVINEVFVTVEVGG